MKHLLECHTRYSKIHMWSTEDTFLVAFYFVLIWLFGWLHLNFGFHYFLRKLSSMNKMIGDTKYNNIKGIGFSFSVWNQIFLIFFYFVSLDLKLNNTANIWFKTREVKNVSFQFIFKWNKMCTGSQQED